MIFLFVLAGAIGFKFLREIQALLWATCILLWVEFELNYLDCCQGELFHLVQIAHVSIVATIKTHGPS